MPFLSLKKLLIIIILLGLAGFLITNRPSLLNINKNSNQSPTPTTESLKIVSTKPDPLEGAILVPDQIIEFNLNKDIALTEFKHKFDPELKVGEDYEIEIVGDQVRKIGKTVKIRLKKLELGVGYTIFILPNTHSTDDVKIDQEHSYHLQTVKYRGI